MEQNLVNAYRWHRQQHPMAKATTLVSGAREDVASGKKRYPSSGKPYAGNWQPLDRMGKWGNPSDRAYYCDSFPWRNLGNVGEIKTESTYRGKCVDHTGWYVDEDCDETVYGVVVQLPARNGKCQYVPGTAHSGCDGATIYPLDHYEELIDAARAADRIAERDAEKEREYNEAWRAGTDASELEEEVKADRKEILAVIKQAKADLDKDAATWRVVADKVRRLMSDICEAREKRDELKSNYGRHEGFSEGYRS